MDRQEQDLATEDQATVNETDEGNETGTQTETEGTGQDETQTQAKPNGKDAETETEDSSKGDEKTLAEGRDTEAEKAKADEALQPKPALGEKWREEIAEHYAAGDKKAYTRELKRLERITDPKALYGMWRELEGKWTSGDLVKKPGKDATPEEIAQYHKQIGAPEKPEDYFDQLELENGVVIGDADKPLVEDVAKAMHEVGTTPEQMNRLLNWYYGNLEDQAAAMDDADDTFRRESESALKEEFGAAYKRKINAIPALFNTAPGGSDAKNENSLYARLIGGRTADGKVIGDDPDMLRFLAFLSHEINPAAAVVEDGDMTGKSIDAELKEIAQFRRDNKRDYFKDEAIQARERELIEAKQKIEQRERA